jgi:DNA-binding Lrp family transcriptional regulator
LALDDLDLRLINAVQAAPRAPWAALAPIVRADAATLGRRWDRLRAAGVVYVTGYLIPDTATGHGALVEIQCAPGKILDVADRLAEDQETFTIDLTSGGRDLIVTLSAVNREALSTWTLLRTRDLPHVTLVRIQVISRVVADARAWRLRALTPAEEKAAAAVEDLRPGRRGRLQPEEIAALQMALGRDGRASLTDLAEQVGIPPRRVGAAIAALRAAGRLVIRVDLARAHTAWPVYAWYFLQVPAAKLERVGPALSRMEEVRMVANTIGQHNVMLAVWLHTLDDVQRLEALIEAKLAGVQIADRSLVLRTVKHLGHLMDERGHATGRTVPILTALS